MRPYTPAADKAEMDVGHAYDALQDHLNDSLSDSLSLLEKLWDAADIAQAALEDAEETIGLVLASDDHEQALKVAERYMERAEKR